MSTMYPPTEEFPTDAVNRRTSLLAILSLVLGILSIFTCPVQIVAPLALFVGVAALIFIGRSRGTLGGKGLAIGGMISGFIGLGLSLLFLFGTLFVVNQIGGYGKIVSSAQSLDEPAVLSLASSRATGIDAESIKAFDDATTAALGDFERVTPGVGAFFMSFTKFSAISPTTLQQYQSQVLTPIPMSLDFAKGPATLVVIVDQGEQSPDLIFGKVVNAAIIPEGASQVIWLVDPAAASGSMPSPQPLLPPAAPTPAAAPDAPPAADPK